MSEILPMTALAEPPGLPAVLAGPLVVLRSADRPVALLVDTVESILTINVDDLTPVRDNLAFNGCWFSR